MKDVTLRLDSQHMFGQCTCSRGSISQVIARVSVDHRTALPQASRLSPSAEVGCGVKLVMGPPWPRRQWEAWSWAGRLRGPPLTTALQAFSVLIGTPYGLPAS